MALSEKQSSVLYADLPRITILDGAISSGKTFIANNTAVNHLIHNYRGDGLVFFIAKTLDTLEKNVLLPLEKQYGNGYFTYSKGAKKANLCGIPIELEGCNDIRAESKIRGTTAEFIYGDELVLWNKSFLVRCMGSLRTPHAKFLGTTNPDTPSNFVWTDFIARRSELEMLYVQFQMEDNPVLTETYKKQVALEYSSSKVLYDRFIKGLWVPAEGLIYKHFADNTNDFVSDDVPILAKKIIGVDWGGNKSGHSFSLSGITPNFKELWALKTEKHIATGTSPNDLYKLFKAFENKVVTQYGKIDAIYADSAEQVLINGLREITDIPVYDSYKPPIVDRIRKLCLLMGGSRFFMTSDCKSLKEALSSAVWDSKSKSPEDKRLDDGTTDIDSIDSFEYSWSWHINYL